jgi:protein-S-isoprenylcysteine O-methyltransferase Ste14
VDLELKDLLEILYFTGFVLASAIRARYARRPEEESITDDRRNGPDILLMVLTFGGMFFLPLIHVITSWLEPADYHLPPWAGLPGAALFVLALLLLWRSHLDLGRNWTAMVQYQEGQSLVTGGIYRQIRHPMYAAHWIWAAALPLLIQNWLAGFSMMVFFLPFYVIRVREEEKMMLEHFGEEYRQYMSRTGRIIPRF